MAALGLAEAAQRALPHSTRVERVVARKDGFVTLPALSRPDIWIGCGRAAVPLARRHKRIFPDCVFAYVQDPRTRHDESDLLAAPGPDRLTRPNAVTMIGSPNRITDEALIAARFASVIPGDWKIRAGHRQEMFPLDLPTITGRDGAGIVFTTRADCDWTDVGEAPCLSPEQFKHGSYAEMVYPP